MEQAGKKGRTIGAYVLSLPIWLYRWLISPWIGPRCRYLPTCSEYALDALMQHGAIKGGWLAACRIGRCHPFGGRGFDPVPEKGPSKYKPASRGCGRGGDEAHARTGFDGRISF